MIMACEGERIQTIEKNDRNHMGAVLPNPHFFFNHIETFGKNRTLQGTSSKTGTYGWKTTAENHWRAGFYAGGGGGWGRRGVCRGRKRTRETLSSSEWHRTSGTRTEKPLEPCTSETACNWDCQVVCGARRESRSRW